METKKREHKERVSSTGGIKEWKMKKGVRREDSRIQAGDSPALQEEKQSVAQIVRDFGIREGLIHKWKKAFRKESAKTSPEKGET